MYSEVKWPQRGRDFTGAQSPYRVPPAKTTKKSCQSWWTKLPLTTKVKIKIKFRKNDLVFLPSAECRTIHFHGCVIITILVLILIAVLCRAANHITNKVIITHNAFFVFLQISVLLKTHSTSLKYYLLSNFSFSKCFVSTENFRNST